MQYQPLFRNNPAMPTDAPAISSRQMFVYYVQVLNDAKIRQIKCFTQWVNSNYSDQFCNFIAEQRENTLRQHAALKSLADVLGIYSTGETCEPVRSLLQEAEQISQLFEEEPDFIEPTVVQLLLGIKYHENSTYRAALGLARQVKELGALSVLNEIIEKEELAYQQLQSYIGSYSQPKQIATNTEVGE
jgi:ferritin-like metal-binding protein YciE